MNPSWILVLCNDSKKKREQNSRGIESIGSSSEDDISMSTPMDEPNGDSTDNTTLSKGNPEEKTEEIKPTENEKIDSPTSTDDEQNEDTVVEPVESNIDEIDQSKDPNFIQNRRILLSNKLIRLQGLIQESIDDVNSSSSFEKKPVILNELSKLLDIVEALIISINRISDHKVILLKYAICVKMFYRILDEI